MEKQYAQALFELAHKPEANVEELVNKFAAHLKEAGRMKLMPRILRELKRLDAQSQSFGESLEVASEKEVQFAASQAKEFGITVEPVVNADLVTGWRARSGSRIIDRSGKRALVDLYRAITAHA